ncbi:MAG TPA: FAD/NAD(P)-binding protein, partial [Actinomycetes bacterium]|nr:FAD/NAD(P)-binding protein [Actinomycetes bacterium]
RHLLNVPAKGMSALPDQPNHFLDWLCRHVDSRTAPVDFARRSDFAAYLDDTLQTVLADSDGVSLVHHRTRATGLTVREGRVDLTLEDGTQPRVDAAVVAPGVFAPGTSWAPAELVAHDRFVADPWAPGALAAVPDDGDVLLVGTGLTGVDVALSLDRPGRALHLVSRRGRLPAVHASGRYETARAPLPELVSVARRSRPADLDHLRRLVARTVRDAVRERRDWRASFDTLRPLTGALWSSLSAGDRARFVREDAAWWDVHRHRMAPASAAALHDMRHAGRLTVGADEVVAVTPVRDRLEVRLRSGRVVRVAAVVNCTGPLGDVRRAGDPFLDHLLAAGVATAGPLGLGLATDDGRLVDARGTSAAPLWTLGAMRRGELWESTAVPEIRGQAAGVASAVHEALATASKRRRRPAPAFDLMGLPLTTTVEAAAAYNRGLDALMHVQSGAAEAFLDAVRIDPDFAAGHAALAMLGHEGGADAVDVQRSLGEAGRSAGRRLNQRERDLVAVVHARVHDCRDTGAKALLRHVQLHPLDVLAVSAAVPTIAFSGVTDIQQEAWELVEGLRPAYGKHWWYTSLLSFVRQDQGRYDEAGVLADRVLAVEPASGHAVHARTHVHYETGDHAAGLRWLDGWITSCGRQATHRAHFSWHAALHELSTGDVDAVRRRYADQLAPPSVTGVRGLVDSASLLWRCQVTGSWSGPVPVDDVIAHAGDDLVERPETPFTAMHSAVALTAAGDVARLAGLEKHASGASDPVLRDVVAPLCGGLLAVAESRWDDAARLLRSVLPPLVRVGGSAAQREVVEETLLHALMAAGRLDEARVMIDERLDRRPSPLDARRRRELVGAGAAE